VKQPAMKAEERAERIVYGRLGLDDVVEHIRAAEQAALERAAVAGRLHSRDDATEQLRSRCHHLFQRLLTPEGNDGSHPG
jgi:hypothetical protein